MALSVRILDAAGAPDALLMNQLKRDLDRHVGDAAYQAGPSTPGTRGDPMTLAFVLALLNAKAVVALVEVLKSYLSRDRTVEVELEGPGGKARFKASDPGVLKEMEMKDRIEAILKPASAP
jgi:hypothetical protein